MKRLKPAAIGAAAFALIAAACNDQTEAGQTDPALSGKREPLALMTGLPIYWPDGVAIDGLVDGDVKLPWIRTALETRYQLTALDTLSQDQLDEPTGGDAGEAADGPLAGFDRLMIVQPRGLSPADNVALDQWVSDGGRLLIVLDPLLVGQYAYPLGDPRNPPMTALIPPVIGRWGLTLSFDDQQSMGGQIFGFEGGELPTIMPGELAYAADGAASCLLEAQARIANCTMGEGRVTVVADATIFEVPERSEQAQASLEALLAKSFH